MSITVAGYEFQGPYSSEEYLEDRSGVYVIVCSVDGRYLPVGCGASATVKSRVLNHDRSDCWRRNCTGTLMAAVYYAPNMQSAGRVALEQKIRVEYSFPCGLN